MSDFSVYQKERTLHYRFFVDLSKYKGDLDPVYYDPLGSIGDDSVYYTWRKGLVTFYPKEIHLSYEVTKQ